MSVLSHPHKLTMLRCIKNLALNPATFEAFEKVGGIPVLVAMLAEQQVKNIFDLTLCRILRIKL